MQINTPKPPIKKYLLISAAILLVGIICYGAYAASTNKWPFWNEQTVPDELTAERDVNDVDYSGPTEKDTEESQSAKKRLIDAEDAEKNNSDNEPVQQKNEAKKPAGVTISNAEVIDDILEIRAFTASVIAGTGECTATVSKSGSKTITKTTPAFVDASSTICEPIFIPKSQLTTGTWNVNVTYSSPTHQGSSGQMPVEVK